MMAEQKLIPLLVVCGPTASGKTSLSIALAKRFGGEVVSADSMQIYRRMDIGTAKPTLTEMEGVPHHLLDILEPGETFSVAQYVQKAKDAIQDISARGQLPILAGGTGLYIDSLTRNLQFAEMPENPGLRAELASLAEQEGSDRLWQMLQECDPVLAEGLHPNNRGRVIRGIEVFLATGVPLSEWQRRSRLQPPSYRLCMLGLDWPRQELYRRVEVRVDEMLRQGLEAEARALYEQGISPTAAQAIGYKELFAVFEGKQTLEGAIELIKQETRRYAKRQMTWLRRDERICWLKPAELSNFAALQNEAETIIHRELGL